MKKKVVLGVIFLIMIARTLIAAPEPLWYRHKEISYPDADFVSAVGRGNTEDNAKTDALKNIALFFRATVSAETTSRSLYTQAVSTTSDKGRKNTIQEDKLLGVLENVVVVSTQAVISGARFTDTWYNEQGRHWAVLCYINKQESLEKFQNRFNTNQEVIDALTVLSNEESELLYKCYYLKSSVYIAQIIEEDYQATAAVLDSAMIPRREIILYTQRVMANYKALCSRLVFDVQIDADRGNRIRNKLFSLFEKQGYVSAPGRGIYTIVGTITTSEIELRAGNFVQSGIILNLVNSEGIPMFSYSNHYPRGKGSTSNWEMAYKFAFDAIEKDLEDNFITRFNAFIGN